VDWQRIAADRRKVFVAKCFNFVILAVATLAILGVAPFSDSPLSVIVVAGALGYLTVAVIVAGKALKERLRRGNSN
jgi:NADH:ubiquinone oxidoreductase subunit 6 (subunit J)